MEAKQVRKIKAFLILSLTSTLIAGGLGRVNFFQTLEDKTLDYRFRSLGQQGTASQELVVVEIDETSLRNMEKLGAGRYPWPRDVYPVFLEFMKSAGAQWVVFDIIFAEGDADYPERDALFVEATGEAGNVVHSVWLGDESEEAIALDFDGDTTDSSSIGANPATLDLLEAHSLPARGSFPEFIQATFPFSSLAGQARALGHVAVIFDSDGPWRQYLPLAAYRDRLIPSLALATALLNRGLDISSVEVDGRTVRAGAIQIPLDADWRLPIWFNGPPRSYKSYPFWEVFLSQLQIAEEQGEPRIDPAEFEGKTVLVGVTAAGEHDIFTTPYSGSGAFGKMAGVELHANVIDDLLHNRYLLRPPSWVNWLTVLALAALALALAFYVRLWVAGLSALTLAAGYLLLAQLVFAARWQLPVVTAVLGWAVAVGLGLAYQYWVEGAEKRQVKFIFSRYVSKDIFQQLMTDPSAAELGGKRAEISVLFSDLRGFTSMSEDRSPEDVIQQLNEYFSGMVAVVFEHQGTIDKFVGDMIMALFNTPLKDEDHADHAVQCAIEMQRRLVEMNRDWKQRGQPELACGVGVNSGEMVAGNLGTESIRSYTVIGDNVNLGARLESLCKEYKSDIIISEFTLALLKKEYPMQELGDVLVKGKSKPVKIFRVFWEPDAKSRPKA